jgi:hypothetical protein
MNSAIPAAAYDWDNALMTNMNRKEHGEVTIHGIFTGRQRC